MLVNRYRRPQYMAATGETESALELFQLQNTEGPCVDVLDLREPVMNVNLSTAVEVWPCFASPARDSGDSSVHALPLRVGHTVVGAHVLFSRTTTAFTFPDVQAVQGLADR